MPDPVPPVLPNAWKDIARNFLKIGCLAYGGPAIMGLMQHELQEKRQWVTKPRFIEGLSLVNMLPGPGATQLGIFLGFSRGGWLGGLIAGLCFVLPAFFIMLALTWLYMKYGSIPLMRSTLYGLGPVVLAIFVVAVYRLGKNAISSRAQILIAIIAGALVWLDTLGIVFALLIAGSVGMILFGSRKPGIYSLGAILLVYLLLQITPWGTALQASPANTADAPTGLLDIGVFFFKVGAFTFGGGLTTIAFVQDQVVNQYQWLTPREFVDGLALGQFTPGPILMIAAYVGYKLAGLTGALVGAVAIFLPSFILMMSILPIFDRLRNLVWMKAAMRGIGPAVIGILAVSLLQLAPHAVPDVFSALIFCAALAMLIFWRTNAIALMLGGALLGNLRDWLSRWASRTI